jgi:hypothetical protein
MTILCHNHRKDRAKAIWAKRIIQAHRSGLIVDGCCLLHFLLVRCRRRDRERENCILDCIAATAGAITGLLLQVTWPKGAVLAKASRPCTVKYSKATRLDLYVRIAHEINLQVTALHLVNWLTRLRTRVRVTKHSSDLIQYSVCVLGSVLMVFRMTMS